MAKCREENKKLKYKSQRLLDGEQVILKPLVLKHFGRWGEEGEISSVTRFAFTGWIWLVQHCRVPRLLEKEIQRTIATVLWSRNPAQDVIVVLEDFLTYCCSSQCSLALAFVLFVLVVCSSVIFGTVIVSSFSCFKSWYMFVSVSSL